LSQKIERLQPLHKTLRGLWLKSRPTAPVKVLGVLSKDHLWNLDTDEVLAFREDKLHRDSWDKADPDFWTDLIESLPNDGASRQLAFDLMKTFLEKAPDDATRAAGIAAMMSIVNLDDDDWFARTSDVLKPYRSVKDSPQTEEILHFLDLGIRVKNGEGLPSQWVDELSTFSDRKNLSSGFRRVADACVAAHDTAALTKLMNVRPSSYWMNGNSRFEAIRAWRFLKMNEEADLAMESTSERIESVISSAWMMMNGQAANAALDFAALVDRRDLVPEAFVKAVSANCRHRMSRFRFIAAHAAMEGQWEECLKAAQDGVDAFPGWQNFSYYKGKALVRLNRKPEAVAPLQFFLKCEKTGHEGVDAATLLKEATAP
jgi:hypothetical protein